MCEIPDIFINNPILSMIFFVIMLQIMYIRGREDQEKFFPDWKVLKVCSKKYIKNYPFFGIIYSIIITAQTLPCFFQLVAILSHFGPFFPTPSHRLAQYF